MKDRKIDWKQFGQFLSMVVKLFTAVTDTFRAMKVGPEILEWVTGPGEKILKAKLRELAQEFQNAFAAKHSPGILAQIKAWEQLAARILGHAVDYSRIKIPERTPEQAKEFTRLIIVDGEYTQNIVFEACQKHFPSWKYTGDLDTGIPNNERDPKKLGTYAIWVRNGVEPDTKHLNKSADMVKAEGLKTETNLERMLHEFVFWNETKGHLDVKGWTRACGSRDSDGSVPNANWDSDEFKVCWYCSDGQRPSAGPREVISLV
jgi:hypothetical protein